MSSLRSVQTKRNAEAVPKRGPVKGTGEFLTPAHGRATYITMRNTIVIIMVLGGVLSSACSRLPIWVKQEAPPVSQTGAYIYFMGKGESYAQASARACESISRDYGNISVSSLTESVDQWNQTATGNDFNSQVESKVTLKVGEKSFDIYPVERYYDPATRSYYLLLAIKP